MEDTINQYDTATVVREIWQDRLNCDQLDKRANYFDLGGKSLDAIRILQDIKLKTGIDLAMEDFLQNPCLEAVSELVIAKLQQPNT